MNPLLLQQQQVMQKQMLEQQARMLASRDMLGKAWAADQARNTGRSGRGAGTAEPVALPVEAVGHKSSSVTRFLLWLIAVAAAARLLAAL